jgi:hypothetical protein
VPGSLRLGELVGDLAEAFRQADALGPVATSQRGTRTYQPGIGPHSENAAVALALEQLRHAQRYANVLMGQFLPYPEAPRQKCDLWIGDPLEWAIEIKMARFVGDNGRVDDMALKDLLSPYAADRSAVTDCTKLAEAKFPSGKAMLIYGFDVEERPLAPAIAAFELLARARAQLGARHESAFGPLVHPFHASGRMFGWEVGARVTA